MKFTPSYEALVHKCAYLKERLLKLQISNEALSTENRALRARATLLKTWADQRSAEIKVLRTQLEPEKYTSRIDYDERLQAKRAVLKARILDLCNGL